jgi:alkanesulfonate monooxygenase SsuD/methylene tetrahydromethanopterin reductase-like flavin-dependent oxidoreductase (luciferase family)
MARLGIVMTSIGGTPFSELTALAKEAESRGVEAIFSPEFMNDALATCQAVAADTSRIKVGTWIANIYLRHPALCAETAVTIDEVSGGRLILGLGVSHRPIVEGVLQEKMEKPRDYLRNYITTVRRIATGEGFAGSPVQPRAAKHGVPIYVAALALGTSELAGELCDGVMLYLCPKSRLPRVKDAIQKGAAKARRQASAVDLTTGLPAFVSNDLSAARAAAKKSLVTYGPLPFYNKLFQNSGFQKEAEILARGDQQAAMAGVSDQMADELNLVGPPSRCQEQLAAFREAGIQLPIIVPNPVGGQTYAQAVRTAIETFAG